MKVYGWELQVLKSHCFPDKQMSCLESKNSNTTTAKALLSLRERQTDKLKVLQDYFSGVIVVRSSAILFYEEDVDNNLGRR